MRTARYNEEPRGSALPALEQNILRYRAMDMILTLFYAEDLRKTILGYVQPAPGTKNPLEKALKDLVDGQVISENERIEIEMLVDYRNHIAHRPEALNADIGQTRCAKDFARFGSAGPKYDYAAVERLCFYRKSLWNRTRSKYIQQLSMAPLLFETTETALKLGLRRLRRTIGRQLAARKLQNAELRAELSLDGTGLTEDLHPNHPLNQYESGNLTARGVEVCYRLFDSGKSPMAVAHLMRISLRAAARRKKMWQAVAGLKELQ